MKVFTLAKAIFDLIIAGTFCEVDNVYYIDAYVDIHKVRGYTVNEDKDLILMEEEY